MPASQKKSSKKRSSSGSSRRRNQRAAITVYYIAGGALIALLLVVLVLIKLSGKAQDEIHDAGTSQEIEITSNEIIVMNAVLDLSEVLRKDVRINILGMKPEDIAKAAQSAYSWSMEIVNPSAEVGSTVIQTVDAYATTEAATMGSEDNPDGMDNTETTDASPRELSVSESISVPDYIAPALTLLISQIAEDNDEARRELETAGLLTETETTKRKSLFSKKETEEETTEESLSEPDIIYTLSLGDLSEEFEEIAAFADTMWYVEPLGGSIGSYDAENDRFIMETSSPGYKVDREELVSLISDAVESAQFDCSIEVPGSTLYAESGITVGDYQIIGTYTTNTTSNSVRNKNIRLACEAVNGTIVRPGEEFSFNNTVGQRTTEKGYGEAAAYNNGEVVQEVGGGVCQVSTTLYNAVVKAGLKVTSRQSHTFEPSYVTPGLDATISWGGPDFKFANVPADYDYSYSDSYAIGIRASYYNQTVTVSIYGRPVLKSGYSYSLSSTKTKELDLVRVLITPDSDKSPTTGSKGSVWETNLIVKKDGDTVSNTLDHMAYYTGHTEYYYEAAETVPETVPESESETETETASEIISDVPLGPGGGTSSDNTQGVYIPSNMNGVYGPGATETTTAAPEPQTEAAPGPVEAETEAATEATVLTPETALAPGPVIAEGPGG